MTATDKRPGTSAYLKTNFRRTDGQCLKLMYSIVLTITGNSTNTTFGPNTGNDEETETLNENNMPLFQLVIINENLQEVVYESRREAVEWGVMFHRLPDGKNK